MIDKTLAQELLKIAKELVAKNLALSEYEDDDDLADDLETELSRFIHGSSASDKAEVVFYEESSKKGESVYIEISVNPRNQPSKKGKVKIGLYITGDGGAPTYEDGIWAFDDTDTVKDVAKTIGQQTQKILRKW